MLFRNRLVALKTLLVLAGTFAFSYILYAFSSGPDDARTGAPGQLTCVDGCHTGNSLNTTGGTFTISGVPANYELSKDYTLTVSLNRSGALRWGFELAVLTVSDSKQAGTITITDQANTQKSTSGGIEYIKHTTAGTSAGQSGPATWSFKWTSPAANVGAVKFYAAGNAANNSNTNQGDFIYTAQAQTGIATDVELADESHVITTYELAQNYPNPFNPYTTIEFSIPTSGHVTVAIYNILGQRVMTLVDNILPSGQFKMRWDGTNDKGMSVSGGIYIYRLITDKTALSRKLIYLK